MVRCISTKTIEKSSECLAQSTPNEFGRSDISNPQETRRLKSCVWRIKPRWIITWAFFHPCPRCQHFRSCHRFLKHFSANGQVATESLNSGSRSPASTVSLFRQRLCWACPSFLDPCLNRTQISNPSVGNEWNRGTVTRPRIFPWRKRAEGGPRRSLVKLFFAHNRILLWITFEKTAWLSELSVVYYNKKVREKWYW